MKITIRRLNSQKEQFQIAGPLKKRMKQLGAEHYAVIMHFTGQHFSRLRVVYYNCVMHWSLFNHYVINYCINYFLSKGAGLLRKS